MSHDVADGTQAEQSAPTPNLVNLGLVGAVARAMAEHQTATIAPKVDAVKDPLVEAFAGRKHSDLTIELGGEEVGRYKVNLTRDRIAVTDEAAFDKYAEDKGEYDIVFVRKSSFEAAVLKRATRDPETGVIYDSETGELIPGLEFVPGGKPTGTVRFTWKTFKGQQTGKAVLMTALMRGDLDELLRETPELLPGTQPAAGDE